jgi:hypothetical protein
VPQLLAVGLLSGPAVTVLVTPRQPAVVGLPLQVVEFVTLIPVGTMLCTNPLILVELAWQPAAVGGGVAQVPLHEEPRTIA